MFLLIIHPNVSRRCFFVEQIAYAPGSGPSGKIFLKSNNTWLSGPKHIRYVWRTAEKDKFTSNP